MMTNPSGRRLGSISIPCLASDLPNIEKIFTLWSDPRFFPMTSSGCAKPTLVIVYNAADTVLVTQTHELYANFPGLQTCFDKLEVFSADLEGDRDLYVRDSETAKGEFGNKAGPTFLFQKTMHFTSEFGLYTFQVELDCIPLGPDWVCDINRIVTSTDAWVIGAPFLGATPLDHSIQFHTNGNALYRSGSQTYITFLDEVWIRNLLMLSKVHPNLAYDCWWALQMARSNASAENAAWHLWQEYCFFFQHHAFVINLIVEVYQASQYTDVYETLISKKLRPLFYHGPVMHNVVAILCEDTSMTVDQALETLEKNSVMSSRKPPENASKGYLFMADLSQKHHKLRPPKLLLGDGFHRPEGLSNTHYPTRYVWSNATRLQVSLTDVRDDLMLFFREGRGRNLHTIENLKFSLLKQEREIACAFDILDNPSFGVLHLRRVEIQTPGFLEIETFIETFTEAQGGRTMGLLFFEIGCRFSKVDNMSV